MKWQVGDRVTNLDTGDKGTIVKAPAKDSKNPDDYEYAWDRPKPEKTGPA